jgi:type IV pilus assembly protein PilM
MTYGDAVDQDELSNVAAQLMVATGLALRSFTPWHI